MTDSLYNPDMMSKEDIKTLFVARQPLLDELVSTIKNQPEGAGVQHVLIIAPRGMGKTTMLLMVQFAVEDSKELSKAWQAIRFPEESYGVTELADFWIKALQYLADATQDDAIEAKIKEIETKFTKSEDLREAAWALVKDWSKKHKKRIVLLVDNFDMILAQIGSQTEQARLRDILMNDGTVMLTGCAPSYFYEIQNYEQPLYNFFKIYNLSDLKFPDIEELLRRRAEIDEIPDIEELLQKNKTRIKALEAFTGGNPRLVLMLYRIITSSDMTEVRKGLERLLDAVTPFYKDKTEKLPPQQRKIINEIAQYSLEKSEGISPTEIAQRIRMTPNQVSTQLKRLSDNGYVKSLNIRGRSSFYALSEPLYAIWAQMRFGRNAREKRNWLVQILKALYDVQEIQKEIGRLSERAEKFKLDGREGKARGTIEYLICLMETNPNLVEENFELAVNSYLELREFSSLKNELTDERLFILSEEVVHKLIEAKIIEENYAKEVNSKVRESILKTFERFFQNVAQDLQEKKYVELYEKLEKLTLYLEEIDTNVKSNWIVVVFLTMIYILRAMALQGRNESKKSIEEYDKAGEILNNKPSDKEAEEIFGLLSWMLHQSKANTLTSLNNQNEAINESNKAIFALDGLITSESKKGDIIKAKLESYLFRVDVLLKQNKLSDAKADLLRYLGLLKQSEIEDWIGVASSNLVQIAKSNNYQLILQLIRDANLEEEFFPLIRAIDCLETNDETLLEKLSPEVQVVVEETIRTLQGTQEENSGTESKQNKNDRKSNTKLQEKKKFV